MAISDDLNSIRTHLEDDYTALEQLGVSVEDRNIENIKDMANQIYAKFPKTSYAEGSNITLSNTLKGKLDFEDGIVGIGDTSQKSYEGYNLLNLANENTILSGTHIVINNGIISLDGTSSSGTNYVQNFDNYYLEAGTYTMHSTISGSSSIGQQFALYNGNTIISNVIYNQNVSEAKQTFTLNERTQITMVKFWISNGTVNTNFTTKIQLEPGSTAHNWEPYVGGTASPSPSYPQEIEVVRGKNRLPLNEADFTTTFYGQNVEIKDEVIKISGSATEVYSIMVGKNGLVTPTDTNRITFKVNSGTYKYTQFTSGTSYSGINVRLKDEDTNIMYTTGSTIILNETHTFSINILVGETSSKNAEIKIQLEKGSQATSYLPYNTLEVVERGINYANYSLLFNNTDCYSISNDNISLLQNDSRATTLIDGTTWGISLKKGTYTLYTSGTGISPQIQIIGKAIGQITRVNYNQLVTFELSQDDIVAIKYLNTSTFPINLGKVMIIKGTITNVPTYEPYQTPQTYQLSLGEYEFAKIGNYADTIEYDVDEDKVYKNVNVGKQILNGDETITLSAISDNTVRIRYSYDLLPYTAKGDLLGLCNRLLAKNIWDIDEEGFFFYGKQLIMRINKETVGTTSTSINAWLENNNMIFNYALEEAVKQEITGTLKDQIKALYYSHSFTGTTIIKINGQLPLIIKVRALKGE